MPEYQNGKVYAIRSAQTDKFYVGSTTRSLSARMCAHRDTYARSLVGAGKCCTVREILKFPDAKIELLERFPCETKEELRKREAYHIRQNRDKIVNIVIPDRTSQEWREDNYEGYLDYQRKWREAHPDYQREWRARNPGYMAAWKAAKKAAATAPTPDSPATQSAS